jgi:glutamate/aspartate transport system substrate-binding protein
MRLFRLFVAAQMALALGASIVAQGALAQSPTLNRIKATGTITFGYRDNAVPFFVQGSRRPHQGLQRRALHRVAGAIQKDLG